MPKRKTQWGINPRIADERFPQYNPSDQDFDKAMARRIAIAQNNAPMEEQIVITDQTAHQLGFGHFNCIHIIDSEGPIDTLEIILPDSDESFIGQERVIHTKVAINTLIIANVLAAPDSMLDDMNFKIVKVQSPNTWARLNPQ